MFEAAPTHAGVAPSVHVIAHCSFSAGSKPSPVARQVSTAWLKHSFAFGVHIVGASIAASTGISSPTHLPLMLPECGPYSWPLAQSAFGTVHKPSGSLRVPPDAHCESVSQLKTDAPPKGLQATKTIAPAASAPNKAALSMALIVLQGYTF